MTEKKTTHGGARKGAGRRSRFGEESGQRAVIWLPGSELKQLRALGDGSISEGIHRILTERASAADTG